MRAFIAVDIDEATRRVLAQLIREWSPIAPKLKWVAPDRIHLTLKFLGDIADADVPVISEGLDDVTREFAPIEVDLRGVGTFGRGERVRVVWAGINDAPHALKNLQRAIETVLEPIGFPPEGRPFAPHLTLARSRAPKALPDLTYAMLGAADRSFGSVYVNEVLLFESTLQRSGPAYRVMSRHALQGVVG